MNVYVMMPYRIARPKQEAALTVMKATKTR